ncbi:MAG: hypothetical protein HZC46_06525 [Ignavibacterium album]|uniref:hypothetical protein n=1 Tax=Ignavibacterium album TaxID=591197 RepID=UPI0026ECD93B|nr:hypothetical protein [Ignavibacterium album]MBI5661782.1 hypothetical protein [Ignavibacterium album]
MKHLCLLITLVLTLMSNSYPQCDNEELINEFISSIMPEERAYGCNLIAQCQLFDYKDELLKIFENEDFVYPATAQLLALEGLGYNDISSLAENFLERIDGMISDAYVDVLESKVIATRILIRHNNFSSFNFLNQIVDRDRPNLTFETVYCLLQVLTTGTQYTEYAKTELINLVFNANEYLLRAATLKGLAKHPDREVLNMLISVSQNNADWSLRNIASQILLTDYYNTQQELLRSLTSSDPEKTNRLTLNRRLLSDWGLPADLFTITENLQKETDHDVITGLNYLIQNFIPPKPDTLGYYDLCIRLISYTDEMFGYDWIHNQETRDYYAERLTEVYQSIENTGEISYACSIINERILPQVEQDRAEELITSEGYKFLHYYTIYIKEEIEEEYGSCP